MFIEKEILSVDIREDCFIYGLNDTEELKKEILGNLEVEMGKNIYGEIRLCYDSISIKNEIISIPEIEKKYIKNFIEKETLQRSKEGLLVDYRYLDERNILVSSVEKKELEGYFNIFNAGISLIRTRMDILLDYYSHVLENSIIIIVNKTYTEIYMSDKDKKYIEKIDKGYEVHIDILLFNIRNTLDMSMDVSNIERIMIMSDLPLESFEESLNISCEYFKINDEIPIENLLDRKTSLKAINFLRVYKRRKSKLFDCKLSNIVILILILLSLFNLNRIRYRGTIHSNADIEILRGELLNNENLLEKLENSVKNPSEEDESVVNEILLLLVESLPRETYIEHISVDDKNIAIYGYGDRRENILLYLKRLNLNGDSYILTSLDQLDDGIGFKFSIDSKDIDEVDDYD